METHLTGIIENYGYIGIFLLIALENVFPPIPSEVILTFGGFMTTTSNLSVTGVVIASTAGSVAGAVILYGAGLLMDVERLEKIVDKWGNVLRLTRKDIRSADAWFDKYGPWTVFFCRMVPLIRSLISIPAGMSNMNFLLFLVLTTLGTFIWNVLLVNIGAAVGSSWEQIVGYMDIYSNVAYVVIVLLLMIFAVRFIQKKRRR